MFRFQISSYDDPALEAETAALLQQRLDKATRKRYPGLFKLSDRLYAHAAMAWAVAVGLINGTTDENGNVILDPQGTATRGQIAAIIERFCENVAK